MAKTVSYPFNVDGKNHELKVTGRGTTYLISIDDQMEQKVKLGTFTAMADHVTEIDGHPVAVKFFGKNVRISVDGFYVDDNTPFDPLLPIPKWAYVFIALNVLIPISTLGGVIPAVIGFGGASACTYAARAKFGTPMKVFISFLITIVAWVLLLIALSMLQN